MELHDNSKSARPNVNRGRARNVSFIHTKNAMMGGTKLLHFRSRTVSLSTPKIPL